jgi:hypothetical protein
MKEVLMKKKTQSESLSRAEFWEKELRLAGALLALYIKELRTHIVNSSKRDPYYLYLRKMLIGKYEFFSLCIAVAGFARYHDLKSQDSIEYIIFCELTQELEKVAERFIMSKHYNFFYNFLTAPESLTQEWRLLKTRTFKSWNEIFPDTDENIRKMFVLRYETQRRVKKQEFRRGYHDKGSISSVSTRARIQADLAAFLPDPHYGDKTTSANFPFIKSLYEKHQPRWRSNRTDVELSEPLPNRETEESRELRKTLRKRRKEIYKKYNFSF